MDFGVSQKWLKTETPEGDQQEAQNERKRDIGLDLPGRTEMDFRVSTKKESPWTAERTQSQKKTAQDVAQPPAPPVVTRKTLFLHCKNPLAKRY